MNWAAWGSLWTNRWVVHLGILMVGVGYGGFEGGAKDLGGRLIIGSGKLRCFDVGSRDL